MNRLDDLPPVDYSGVIDEMASYFQTAPWQLRPDLQPDDRLMEVAQARANDMATHDYFDHVTPQGEWPHKWVRTFGYKLPDFYPDNANYIESIAMGYKSAVRAMDALVASPTHMAHMTGQGFWADHLRYGVGFAWVENRRIFVVVTAPVEKDPQPQPAEVLHLYFPQISKGIISHE